MAGSVNKVILIGNLGADPEIRRLQYLRKGMKVYVEGSLQTRKWTDQSGNDKYTTEIVLQKFRGELQMLETKSAQADDGDSPNEDGEVPF